MYSYNNDQLDPLLINSIQPYSHLPEKLLLSNKTIRHAQCRNDGHFILLDSWFFFSSPLQVCYSCVSNKKRAPAFYHPIVKVLQKTIKMNNVIRTAFKTQNVRSLFNATRKIVTLNSVSQRQFARNLWYMCNSRNDLISNLKLETPSTLCSCGCGSHGIHTKGIFYLHFFIKLFTLKEWIISNRWTRTRWVSHRRNFNRKKGAKK